ncbi:MAG: peptide deformylase [Candidatus Magasanikbacteria bacterium]
MILPITKLPNENLRQPSQIVDTAFLLTDEIQNFIDQMIPTMYADDGIGLASPQVGKNIQICVIGQKALPAKIKIQNGTLDNSKDLILVNPKFKPMSRKKEVDIEGCLSVPKIFGKVRRYKSISVTALDRNGNPLEFEANTYFARVIQHEIDHLQGILFIDKAKELYREE